MDSMHMVHRCPIDLQPFIHQVGGHTGMLQVTNDTLCKPLHARELQFYTALPKELAEFTAQYRGIMEAELSQDADGYARVVGYPPGCDRTSPCSLSSKCDASERIHPDGLPQSETCRSHLLHKGGLEMMFGVSDLENRSSDLFCSMDNHQTGSSEFPQCLNPWGLHCHKKQLAKLSESGGGQAKPNKFMLLENITAKFVHPCILDLKMGTRQHGDGASEEKRRRFKWKCETSTSAALGTRICGMQVYQSSSNQYICRNKYYGRKLTVNGFKEELLQYLHNGSQLRSDLLPLIISKLRKLHSILEKHDSFRFYSSSLLIIYEGCDAGKPQMSNANDAELGENDNHEYGRNISETELCLASDKLCLSNIDRLAVDSDSRKQDSVSVDTESSDTVRPSLTCDNVSLDSNSPSVTNAQHHAKLNNHKIVISRQNMSSTLVDNDGRRGTNTDLCMTSSDSAHHYQQICAVDKAASNMVDVRMIDFAHSTYPGFPGDSDEHQGPDHGYMLGVKSLVDVFCKILAEQSIECL